MLSIELYSVRSFLGSALKSRLEDALALNSLPYKVREINNVDDFIRAGLPSVPALKIGDKVIEHNSKISFEETIQKAIDVIMDASNHFILVPVDFTPESLHALHYARLIASKMGIGLLITHVHEPLFDPMTGTALDAEMMKRNDERLKQLVLELGWDHYKTNDHVPVKTRFATGDIVSQLHDIARHTACSMVIMSTRSEDSLYKRIMGSVSTRLSRQALKPVIVVPPGAEIRFPDKVVVGLSEQVLKEDALASILAFGGDHQMQLEFVMAANEEDNFGAVKAALHEKLIQSNVEQSRFNIVKIPFEKGRIHEALTAYAGEANAGMLLLVTAHRNLIANLMHHSVSKNALLQPALPLMIIHTGD